MPSTSLTSHTEVGTCDSICAATILLAIAFAPQFFLNGCAGTSTTSIVATLSASAIQIRLGMIVFQSNVIKVKKKH